jgi:excisionase family DNA binding protein
MKEIQKVRINYKEFAKKLDDLAELIALYHDQPLNIQRASEYLGLAKSTMYQMIYKKTIPHYKPTGKMVYFSRLELNKWAFMHKIMTVEEMNEKSNQYVQWGKIGWDWKDYELIYKNK